MTAYVDVDELARVLRLRAPTPAQGTAMARVLDAAAYEIDSEVFGSAVVGSLGFGTPYPPLAIEVNLSRARDLWAQEEAAFGVIGMGEPMPIVLSADTWSRYANLLAPLKQSWGIA